MAGTTNNIDLVPREDLDALAALNKELINLLNSLKEVGRELSKTTLNYKELSVAINKVEEEQKSRKGRRRGNEAPREARGPAIQGGYRGRKIARSNSADHESAP